jgi:hypothetical protein
MSGPGLHEPCSISARLAVITVDFMHFTIRTGLKQWNLPHRQFTSFLPSHELACNHDYILYYGHFILSFDMEPSRWRRNLPQREELVNTLWERGAHTLCLPILSGMISTSPSGCRMTPWNLPGAISHLFDRAPQVNREERRVSRQKLVRLEGWGQRRTTFMDWVDDDPRTQRGTSNFSSTQALTHTSKHMTRKVVLVSNFHLGEK